MTIRISFITFWLASLLLQLSSHPSCHPHPRRCTIHVNCNGTLSSRIIKCTHHFEVSWILYNSVKFIKRILDIRILIYITSNESLKILMANYFWITLRLFKANFEKIHRLIFDRPKFNLINPSAMIWNPKTFWKFDDTAFI